LNSHAMSHLNLRLVIVVFSISALSFIYNHIRRPLTEDIDTLN